MSKDTETEVAGVQVLENAQENGSEVSTRPPKTRRKGRPKKGEEPNWAAIERDYEDALKELLAREAEV